VSALHDRRIPRLGGRTHGCAPTTVSINITSLAFVARFDSSTRDRIMCGHSWKKNACIKEAIP
jgi:hypothetical protein